MTDMPPLSCGAALVHWCGADAVCWARAFNAALAAIGERPHDEEFLIGWFANAIMHSHDVMSGAGPINGDHAQWLLDREVEG